jgi:hypothetical protein
MSDARHRPLRAVGVGERVMVDEGHGDAGFFPCGRGFRREVIVCPAGTERVGGN